MARIVEQRDTSALPPGTAVCLGAFDGMHIGHQALLSRAKALGEHLGMVTFDPHPQQVLAPERAPALLQTPVQRRRVCAALGVDHLVLLPFDREVARMSAEAFARTVLVEGLRPRAVVVGEDFRFGRGREGDGAMLAELLAPAGIEVARVPAVPMPESAWLPDTDPSHKLGATAVRDAVRAGQVERAGAMLGRWHSVPGTVVHDARRGRTIGFPTANLDLHHEIRPPPGVYAVRAHVDGEVLPAVANVGVRPTFGPDGDLRVEHDADVEQPQRLDRPVDGHLVAADGEARPAQRLGHIAAGDRAVELARLAGLAEDHHRHAVELGGHRFRFGAALQVGGLKLGALALEIGEVFLGRAQRLALRQQIVAGVAGPDPDGIAHLAQVLDTLQKNDFHRSQSRSMQTRPIDDQPTR